MIVGRIVTLILVVFFLETGAAVSETARESYDRYRTQAAAALSQGNLANATSLATQAYSNFPDGTRIVFVPNDNGVAATIMYPTSKTMRQQLTLTQFKIWLTELTEYDYWSDFAKEGYTAQKNPGTVQKTPGVGYVGQHAYENLNRPATTSSSTSTQPHISESHKYRPPLTPEQVVRPSNYHQQFLVALSAYDEDLVRIAFVRFTYNNQRLAWLEKAQQQRDANNINKTKPLIYPVR
jgi:hypothetical protein